MLFFLFILFVYLFFIYSFIYLYNKQYAGAVVEEVWLSTPLGSPPAPKDSLRAQRPRPRPSTGPLQGAVVKVYVNESANPAAIAAAGDGRGSALQARGQMSHGPQMTCSKTRVDEGQ